MVEDTSQLAKAHLRKLFCHQIIKQILNSYVRHQSQCKRNLMGFQLHKTNINHLLNLNVYFFTNLPLPLYATLNLIVWTYHNKVFARANLLMLVISKAPFQAGPVRHMYKWMLTNIRPVPSVNLRQRRPQKRLALICFNLDHCIRN